MHRMALYRSKFIAAAFILFVMGMLGNVMNSAPAVDAAPMVAFAQVKCAYIVTVTRGDWLSKIAPQTWRTVAANNNLRNANIIFPGQKLCITPESVRGISERRLVAVHVTKPTKPAKPASGSKGSQPTVGKTGTTAPVSGNLGPCGGNYNWAAETPSLWKAPVGCFGRIFSPSSVSTAAWHSPGFCNWVVEALHRTNNLWGLPHISLRPGAAIFFSGGVYGASSAGHWANVVSIHGGWMLIIEENFTWRGGGFGRIDYRFVPIGRGETFL